MKQHNVKYYLAASISLIPFFAYLPSLHNEFIMSWDDDLYVLNNPFITSLNPAFFKWAFFDFYAANWHPLTWMSHALDYAVWGLNPLGHHLTNNILHAVNTFLVVLLAVKLIEVAKPVPVYDLKSTPHHSPFSILHSPFSILHSPFSILHSPFTILHSPFRFIAAATTGLLFGLHPVHVESVAWVAERKDLLCALFFLLSIMMYVRYASDAKRRAQSVEGQHHAPCAMRSALFPPRHAPCAMRSAPFPLRYALFAFALALLSKPMAVTLPVVLLIVDWYPLRRIQSLKSFRAVCVEKLPFFALSLVSSILTILAQNAGRAIRSLDVIPFSSRMLVAAKSMIMYLWKMIMPMDLVPYYPYPKEVSFISFEYLSAIVLITAITAACLLAAKKHKLFLSIWGYYAITLVPIIGIVQVGEQSMADRYTYLPSVGPFLLAGLGAAWVLTKVQTAGKRGRIYQLAAFSAAICMVVSLAWLTLGQIALWKNGFTLWTYVIEKQPNGVPHAYNNRGNAFINSGQLDKALADYDKAIELDPRYCEAYYNRGVAYGQAGLFDKSIESFSKSLELDPNKVDAYVNRGVSYTFTNRYDSALEDFNTALRFNQDHNAAYVNRGRLYRKMGKPALALADFQKACDLGNASGCKALNALRSVE